MKTLKELVNDVVLGDLQRYEKIIAQIENSIKHSLRHQDNKSIILVFEFNLDNFPRVFERKLRSDLTESGLRFKLEDLSESYNKYRLEIMI